MSILLLRAHAFTSAVAAMLSGCTPSRAISASCSVACDAPRPALPLTALAHGQFVQLHGRAQLLRLNLAPLRALQNLLQSRGGGDLADRACKLRRRCWLCMHHSSGNGKEMCSSDVPSSRRAIDTLTCICLQGAGSGYRLRQCLGDSSMEPRRRALNQVGQSRWGEERPGPRTARPSRSGTGRAL